MTRVRPKARRCFLRKVMSRWGRVHRMERIRLGTKRWTTWRIVASDWATSWVSIKAFLKAPCEEMQERS